MGSYKKASPLSAWRDAKPTLTPVTRDSEGNAQTARQHTGARDAPYFVRRADPAPEFADFINERLSRLRQVEAQRQEARTMRVRIRPRFGLDGCHKAHRTCKIFAPHRKASL